MSLVHNSFKYLISHFDHYQQNHKRAGFLFAVIKKYREDEAGRRAALFTYYGFLALFPLLLVLTSALRLFLRDNTQLKNQIIHGANTYFPVIGHDLQQNIHGLAKTGIALAIGLLLTLYGARGVADVLRSGLDHIWQVPRGRRSGFPTSLFRSLGIIIIGGLGLLLSPIVAGYALVFGHNLFFNLLSILLTLIFLFFVMIFVMKIGLSVHKPLRQIWVGAAIAAICLEILQSLGGYLVARELRNLDNLYGTFAIILGLIYWIYIQAQVLFYVFELDSVRVLRLWPRSIQHPLTNADQRAFRMYINRAKFHDIDDYNPDDQ
jgi:YihY family inner membrane protein